MWKFLGLLYLFDTNKEETIGCFSILFWIVLFMVGYMLLDVALVA